VLAPVVLTRSGWGTRGSGKAEGFRSVKPEILPAGGFGCLAGGLVAWWLVGLWAGGWCWWLVGCWLLAVELFGCWAVG